MPISRRSGESGTARKDRTSGACPLAACERGCRAAVLRVACPGDHADRLRTMGLYEGSCVTVVERQNGMLLEVSGSRLALAQPLAESIEVLPLGG